jgi:hypothetical protein
MGCPFFGQYMAILCLGGEQVGLLDTLKVTIELEAVSRDSPVRYVALSIASWFHEVAQNHRNRYSY